MLTPYLVSLWGTGLGRAMAERFLELGAAVFIWWPQGRRIATSRRPVKAAPA